VVKENNIMEIGYHARRTLEPTLMEWVEKSRINKHLPPNSKFILFLDDTLYFNLSHLSIEYKTRHILPNLSVYSMSLLQNLLPVMKVWLAKNNLHDELFNLIFTCDDKRYTTNKVIQLEKDDVGYRSYLTHKST